MATSTLGRELTRVPKSNAGEGKSALPVRPLAPEDQSHWDEFVQGHPQGSPFPLLAWRNTIEATFRYRPLYCVAVMEGRVRGVLPLFLVKNILVGKALISSPFAVYGGALADSPEVRDAFAQYVRQLAESLRVEYVELRNAHSEQCLGFASVSRYITFTQQIGPDEQVILNSIPRKTRHMVRKGLKANLATRRQTTEFAAFEDLYSKNLRRLGTPSFPRKHFANLLANFGAMADIRETRAADKVVAAVLSFYFRDQVFPYYGASDPTFNELAPNNFMYYDLMRWGGQNGYRLFDFGRSKRVKGSYDFKSHWGMAERELPYELILIGRKEMPNYTPVNPIFRLPILCWQRLPL